MNDSLAEHLDTLHIPLTVNEVTELLGVHRDTIYRWVRVGELPALNVGITKTILRFPPKELAAWVRERQSYFHGPARFITDWMEEQVLRRGGPRFLPEPLPRVLEMTGYDWIAAARRVAADPSLSFASFHLMSDFSEAVKRLPIGEQRQLLVEIKSGKLNDPDFAYENAE
jgi:excisionase family DNA binding protein